MHVDDHPPMCQDLDVSPSASRRDRRDRLQSLGHFLTALVLAVEGYAKLEHPDGYWPFIGLCWLASAAILVVTVAHHRIERWFPPLQLVVHFAEGAVCAALVLVTRHEGKVALPYAWLLAAVLLLGLALGDLIRFLRRPVESAVRDAV